MTNSCFANCNEEVKDCKLDLVKNMLQENGWELNEFTPTETTHYGVAALGLLLSFAVGSYRGLMAAETLSVTLHPNSSRVSLQDVKSADLQHGFFKIPPDP